MRGGGGGGGWGISINMFISTEGLGIPTTRPKTSFLVSVLGTGVGVMNGAISNCEQKIKRKGQYNCDGGSHLYLSYYYT